MADRRDDPRLRLRRVVARFEIWWAGFWPWRYGSSLQFWPGRALRRAGVLPDEWMRFRDGVLVEVDSRNIIHKLLLRDGRYAAPIHDEIVRSLDRAGVFVDVGANFGYFSVAAARHAPEGRVLAVEADPTIARKLAEHARRNDVTNIEIVEAACWHEDGMLDLYVAGAANPGKTSLSSANAYSSDTTRVHARPLDSIVEESSLERLDLVKIDVEGAELHVLLGMQRTIDRFRPRVILEAEASLLERFDVTLADVLAFFDRHGYSARELTPTDLLFTPLD
jgi:FkbM family methyltransferase